MASEPMTYVAFASGRRIASGDLPTVALAAKEIHDGPDLVPVFVLDAVTSEPVELDLRGTAEDVVRRLPREPEPAGEGGVMAPSGPRPVGRPRLGVVAREVTLLPRHWEWLATQPGGASVTLRKLVEGARRASGDSDRMRAARDSAYRFMFALAGDLPGFEDASRALFAGDPAAFERWTNPWPPDLRGHARDLARRAFGDETDEATGADR